MVFTAFLFDKTARSDHDGIMYMESFEIEDEAYLALGRELKEQTGILENWTIDIDDVIVNRGNEERRNKLEPLIKAVEQGEDISKNAIFMKLFYEYYNFLVKYVASDETLNQFGVRET